MPSRGPAATFRDVRRTARATPPGRERHVDLMRAAAISLVVLGHWLAVIVTYDAQRGLDGRTVLGLVGWVVPLTWLFQVMPVFFLVGGYANAASWRSHRDRAGPRADWLLGRLRRLLWPTSTFLATVALAAVLARAVGADGHLVGTAAWLATLPLWFLVVYLATVALTPLVVAAHRRLGLLVPVLLALAVGFADLLRLGFGVPHVGDLNYLLAWLAIHQLGIAWQDGRLPSWPADGGALVGGALVVGGVGALVLLTTLGPYPASMVAVPGEALSNTAPPTPALLALAAAQTGVVLLLRTPADRWLARSRRAWTVVVGLNAVVMTVFLWHMAAVVVAALLLVPTGLWPDLEPGSSRWVLWRMPWVLALLAVLAAFVLLFSRAETAARTPLATGGRGRRGLIVIGLLLVIGGLLGIGLAGRGDHGPAGLPTRALFAYAAGAVLLALAAPRPEPAALRSEHAARHRSEWSTERDARVTRMKRRSA